MEDRTHSAAKPAAALAASSALAWFRHAAQLARHGRFLDAEMLICAQLRQPSGIEPRLWDLLARIYAQQGRALDAESCWQAAIKLSPGTTQYQDALKTLQRLSRPRAWVSPSRILFEALLLIFCTYLGILLYSVVHQRPLSNGALTGAAAKTPAAGSSETEP